MVSRKRAKGKARKAAAKTSNSGAEVAAEAESTLSNQIGAELTDGLDHFTDDMPAELRECMLDFERSTNKSINAMKDLRASGGSDGDIISRLSHEPDSDKKKSEAEIAFENVLKKLELSEVVAGPPITFDDCDICMERMPPRTIQSSYLPCCGKVICRSCWVRGTSPFLSEMLEGAPMMEQFLPSNFEKKCEKIACPFCRSADAMSLTAKSNENRRDILEQRAKNKEPRATLELGRFYESGYMTPGSVDIIGKDDRKAVKCFEKAASLGNGDACYELSKRHQKLGRNAGDQRSLMLFAGDYLACLEKAAGLGTMEAHHELAEIAMKQNNFKVAMSHYKVLAAVGYDKHSIDQLTVGYKDGHVTKDELASSLRAYHTSRKEFATHARCQLELLGAGMSKDGEVTASNRYA